MNDELLTSKVLIHETDDEACLFLKEFLHSYNLTGLRDGKISLIDIFKKNTDLGAAFVSNAQENEYSPRQVVQMMHENRPEIPIFLRLKDRTSEVPNDLKNCIAGSYCTGDVDILKGLVDKYLFSKHYPVALIRGIQDASKTAFNTIFSDVTIDSEMPYLVNDQYIYGEMFSLIPLESNWCRGFMMLQSNESDIVEVISAQHTSLITTQANFRDVNHVLGELTNLIWGDLKSNFFTEDNSNTDDANTHRIHVPTLVNHSRKYISFGTSEPYLCFKYTFKSTKDDSVLFSIYQKIIFNLSWEPEQFKESQKYTESLVTKGELEFF